MADVELRLDEVGEREGGGGVRRAARPGGVEDGPRAREVADDGDPAAGLDDGGVAAGPLGEVAQGPAAGGVEGAAQLGVGRTAAAEDREPGEGVRGVGGQGADLVGAPVADGPEGVGVSPEQLGADGVDGAFRVRSGVVRMGGVRDAAVQGRTALAVPARTVSALAGDVAGDPAGRAEARGDTAPTHQPAHRRLPSLWAHDRGTGSTDGAEGAAGGTPGGSGPCCHGTGAREG